MHSSAYRFPGEVVIRYLVAAEFSSESQDILLLLDAEEDKRLDKLSKLATKYLITICIIIKKTPEYWIC